MLTWNQALDGYTAYLTLERGLSRNSVEAYANDIRKLALFCENATPPLPPDGASYAALKRYLKSLHDSGVGERTQARNVSSLRSFFRYLVTDGALTLDPTEKLESPRCPRTLPGVLSIGEIEALINAAGKDDKGQRDRAIIETLYSCGLRVSELINLRLSDVNFRVGFVKVLGKGNKERIVPLGTKAKEEITAYRKARETLLAGRREDILFLNRFGRKLSRVSVFNIIKDLTLKAGVCKVVSPHTLRHSFASHLVNGGADIRVVQGMLGHASILTSEIYTHLDSAFLLDTLIQHHPRAKKKK
ncbi:MAG: tyrosine recombinase XerD [Odoribacteraceae bacterium]|jgi:integrase/recombinase XerD|nr:tyrosine recombinase XerD [Odoribacteraceae bacterium]